MGTNAVSFRPSNPAAKLISGVEQLPKSSPVAATFPVAVDTALELVSVVLVTATLDERLDSSDPDELPELFPLLLLDDLLPELELEVDVEEAEPEVVVTAASVAAEEVEVPDAEDELLVTVTVFCTEQVDVDAASLFLAGAARL